jgi:hypothetical protein
MIAGGSPNSVESARFTMTAIMCGFPEKERPKVHSRKFESQKCDRQPRNRHAETCVSTGSLSIVVGPLQIDVERLAATLSDLNLAFACKPARPASHRS